MSLRSSGTRCEIVQTIRSVLGLLLIAPCCLSTGCREGVPAVAPPPPPEVLVTDVVQKDVPIYYEWVGTTDGFINAQIRPRVQGYLQSRNYREGSLVKANDLMVTIDPREYQAALNQAKADLGRAKANLGFSPRPLLWKS